MSPPSKDIDSTFQGAGATSGLEIWCIENHRLVPIPKSSHGKFYSGSAYVILNTVLQKSGSRQHNIHYWLGNEAKEEDLALASDKALELDDALGLCAVQYREVQGQETEKFLSYFKPCIIPVEGIYSSETGNVNGDTYHISLFTCKGDHAIHVKEVPFSRSSLNHFDVFILDTASKIYLFSGCNSSVQERAKALEVVQYINETKHNGNCEVATIEDGKFVGDADAGEFWSLFGGYAPIPRDSPSAFPEKDFTHSIKLFRITLQGQLCELGAGPLTREMLEADKCYMLDCDSEIFVWMGRSSLITERRTSISATEGFLRNEGRSVGARVTLLTEGLETTAFRSHFVNWPHKVDAKLYEEGRGKVAAIFKQHGYDVKELPEDECEPVINCRGMIKVWRVNGDQLSLLPIPEQTKLYTGDCYIVQYTYSSIGKDENLFYAWFGRASLMEDRVEAICHMNALADSTRGHPVLARVLEDKEPEQLFLIFQTLIVLKGGQSSRYTTFIAEKGLPDETYHEGKTALFRVQGKSPNNMQAIQVDQVSSCLNSSYCYILQTGPSVFTWIGNLSSTRDHDLLDRMLEYINPAWQHVSVREGCEPDEFWEALGGRSEYPKEKETAKAIEDPHLFTLILTDGDFKVKEIYNFTQGDLTTEDVFILDCHDEIYVWIGFNSSIASKGEALTLGQKYLEKDVLVKGLSLDTPIYVVTEGHEPQFFTRFFSWDPSKANLHGNSFERKLAILKGGIQPSEAPTRNSWKRHSRGATPDSSRSSSVSSNGHGRSGSPLPNFRSSYDWRFSSPTPIARKLFSEFSPANGIPEAQLGTPAENINPIQIEESAAVENLLIYPYERLKVTSDDPVEDIDVTRREAYLSEDEFQEKFEITRKSFYQLPKWRQNKLKMTLHLF
ncbi:villin-1 isoform X2 [Punica granatum]|uniref:Villin-1 isoform X2 n=2 Tax=Punica granatum TaxID=22663 RepID=A0A6P8CRG3_PUNGR|nr:villin-1 isoform X2 [Punica granatum]